MPLNTGPGSESTLEAAERGREAHRKDVAALQANTLLFFVNGRKVTDPNVAPETTLLTYLRQKLRLPGTKLGCGEGGCGACTVMVSHWEQKRGKAIHISANACLMPVVAVHGMAVTTIEGIGSTRTKLHAVQQRMADSHGSQCGFCTPGIVMSMYTLLRNKPKPNMDDIETYFQGNLCRCTGYRPILEGFKVFTEEGDDAWSKEITGGKGIKNGCSGAKNGVCCKMQGGQEKKVEQGTALYNHSEFIPYDQSQEPIFPPELKLFHDEFQKVPVSFVSKEMTWHRATTLEQLLALKAEHPNAKLVVGNTELGIEMKFKGCKYPIMIQPGLVPELSAVTLEVDGLKLGAAVTLSCLEDACKDRMASEPPHATRVLAEVVDMLHWFGGKQIRNMAAIGGNIMTGSPISDLNPIFMAAGCILEVMKAGDKAPHTIEMDDKFYTGYRKNVLTPEEILLSIKLPYTRPEQHFIAYKQAKRRDDDIAIVNAAFFLQLDGESGQSEDQRKVKSLRMSFGGMAPTTIMAKKTMEFFCGKPLTQKTLDEAMDHLLDDLPLPPEVPGAMVRYRHSLSLSFLLKAFLTFRKEAFGREAIDSEVISATEKFYRPPVSSNQFFEVRPTDPNIDAMLQPVGKPVKHKSADKQAAGEALFIDDLPAFEGELHLGYVYSEKAHAVIKSIDFSEAETEDGYVDHVSSSDLTPEQNNYRLVLTQDEHVFAAGEVHCVGQVIAAVVARDQASAKRAAKKVRVSYEELPAVITIEQAIEQGSYYQWPNNHLDRGDPDTALSRCAHVVEGEMRTGAQEHFYMEPNAALAVPANGEDGEMRVYACTQYPLGTQELVARCLGIPMSHVVCHTRRLGGGFGGKETRCIHLSMACALAARKTGRPVRVTLDRDEDMMISGNRHPFLGKYKVGCDADGMLQALVVDLYSNAGCTMDMSFSVMERAMLHSDGSYHIPNVRVRGHLCKTNLASNCAFRGFGGPQGMLITETWMDELASKIKVDPMELRKKNMYPEQGAKTHHNQLMPDCNIRRCWEECYVQAQIEEQQLAIKEFNSSNKWKKRGLSMIPVKYGVAFGVPHLNQGGALVQIYKDGSVLLSHGGTEMGQGLHTKMIQIAAQVLGVPHERVHLTETATDKVPNASPTAASMGSDLYGMAVLAACRKLNKRLEPIKSQCPGETWEFVINKAYFDRVSLSATGFYSAPDIGYDMETNTGNAFSYFTYGAGASVVEVDCLTGDSKVLRTDIVMDLGESLNPAIDIGQIEGAFMQGYGLFMMEQLLHTPTGHLVTRGPGAYKIPSFGDIPSEFNVSLLRGASNPRAVFSSKAVGEPPLFLAASAFFAVKEAIRAQGNLGAFKLESPATAERIRMACDDEITRQVPELPEKGTYDPWAIQV